MRNKPLALLLAALVASLTIAIGASPAQAGTTTRYVDNTNSNTDAECPESDPCETISDALDAADDGDTIIVQGTGTDYEESNDVDDEVTIEGKDDPVVVEDGDTVFEIFANNVTIRGLKIEGNSCGSNGVSIDTGYSGILIENNQFDDTCGAVLVFEEASATIRKNTIRDSNEYGIHLFGGVGDVTIERNTILTVDDGDDGHGIWSEDDGNAPSGEVTIIGNTIRGTYGDCIHISNPGTYVIKFNHLQGCGDDGIEFDSTDATVSLNIVRLAGDNGIEVDDDSGYGPTGPMKVTANIVVRSADDGIDLSESDDVVVRGNVVLQSTDDGIDVEGDDHEILGNIIAGSGDDGLFLADSYDNTIRGNKIFASTNFDIVDFDGGSNDYSLNLCRTSDPGGLCGIFG